MSRENVLIFGLGGIGGVYACLLHLSKRCDVSVVARSNYTAVKEKGFKMTSPKFGNHEDIQFAGVYRDCVEAAASGKKFSYVLCANKALLDSTPSLADMLRPIISSTTSIALLQNGVGAEVPLHAAFPNTTIISAVVWTGGRTMPDGVEHFNDESMTIGVDYIDGGDRAAEDAKLARLVESLEAAGGTCNVTKDIQSERWIKVIWNCCWNSLTTVTRLRTNNFFASSPQALPLCYTVMEEVTAVARAKGLSVPEDTVEGLIKKCTAFGGPGLPSSMMFDVLAGRAMEVEVILGTPLREGERLGVPVPTLKTLYTIVKALDYGNAHPDTKET